MDADDRIADDNLADHAELSEAFVVDAIESRYRRNLVYTLAGSILLAVNPFRAIEGLYGEGVLRAYESPNPVPHVYGVASAAYRALQQPARALSNQTILISGDSGSGKTESTKRILDYFMHVGRSSSHSATISSSDHLTRHIVAANRVLEAFGNAHTLRNANSSRFGKFIQLDFRHGHALVSASIQTYLLETVRIVSRTPVERNYHVFYELLRGAAMADLSTWQLLPSPSFASQDDGARRTAAIDSFRYLGHGPSTTADASISVHHDDAALYVDLEKAMMSLGLPSHDVFRIVAAVLHLGNICFDQMECHSSDDIPSQAMAEAAVLLHVPLRDLRTALTTRTLVVANEVQVLPLSPQDAGQARDGLAKALYARLFDWLVDCINTRLSIPSSPSPSSRSSSPASTSWIGVLDIFGFEHFAVNSFEQLCINYTNEVLHQQFIEHVFKMEQAEYAAEGLDWMPLAYEDNADRVELFSAKHTGLFALLDEESLLAQGSDAAFASKLSRERGNHRRFKASHGQQSQRKFTIDHFAGPVEYTATGFREKNVGVLAHDVVGLLQGSTSRDSFVRRLFQSDSGSIVRHPHRTSLALHKKTKRHESVAGQFQTQLGALMKRLDTTQLHYVRCLKPNSTADSMAWHRPLLLEQLRCHGVVDAIRMARLGFPIRMTHDAFWCRYRAVVGWSLHESARPHDLARALVERKFPSQQSGERRPGLMTSEHIQVGVTKVFLHGTAHTVLESHRAAVERATKLVLAHALRGFVCRRRFLCLRRTTMWCQRQVRRTQTIRRQHGHATKLQRVVKVWLTTQRCRQRLLQEHDAATTIQTFVRLVLLRQKYSRRRQCAVVLQRWWHRCCQRRHDLAPQRVQERMQALPSPSRPASIVRSSWAADSELSNGSHVMNDVIWRTSSIPLLLSPEAETSWRGIVHHADRSIHHVTAPHPVPPSPRIAPVLPPLTFVDPATLPPLTDYFSCWACTKRFKALYRRRYCSGKTARVCLVCAALHQGTTETSPVPRGHAVMHPAVWHQPWPEPPIPSTETSRLAAVAQLDLDNLQHDVMIQHICTMVYHTWPGAVAFVGIMDQTKQIMLTSVGCSMFPKQLTRDVALCAHTVCETRPLVVMDATKDPRFMYNPLVKGGRRTKKFTFYMGAQLVDEESRHVLGTIAVLHTIPRKMPVQQCELQVLENFAGVVSHQLTRSKTARESSFV
ncbi:hypothetical protein, variant [Aphanomyces invadans]|uniref:Myosin motor domain-containing protein n=1 Tax=Aphanomyces invadans TaxID=157072 RepID=A0A024URH9_9STRA|nr:hypothetical protein, variant [Aphanomyces invadans]ETW09051.1 hypothetical protein, variant [Aphanomyces invadans]|eukprot:XP_008862856.1 hypothetical protein, variant [Aphanomyces invadans]